jgi:hypothetical protein
MHNNRARIEQALPIEIPYLTPRHLICPLAGVNEEDGPLRSHRARSAQVTAQCRRVSPPVLAHHADGKIAIEHFRMQGIVVADGGYAAQEVPDPSPPHTHVFRHGAMDRNDLRKAVMNVHSPLDIVAIWSSGQSRKERELQVIVRIDESGQYEESAKIKDRPIGRSRSAASSFAQGTVESPAAQLQRTAFTRMRAGGAASAAKNEWIRRAMVSHAVFRAT